MQMHKEDTTTCHVTRLQWQVLVKVVKALCLVTTQQRGAEIA